MSAEVLQSMSEVEQARAELERRNLSCVDIEFGSRSLWQRLRRVPQPKIGDRLKSWDVLRTIEFVERNFAKDAAVLDLGAYSSEILPALHRAGFTSLTGIDLNPQVPEMPYADRIRYEVGNYLSVPRPLSSFDVVTAISVIEHGFDPSGLLAELARILRPEGCFVASVDYWQDKVDTKGTRFFGLDWCIFSRAEVQEFIRNAAGFGLRPVGDLHLDCRDRPVHCAGCDYTFAWFALRRTSSR